MDVAPPAPKRPRHELLTSHFEPLYDPTKAQELNKLVLEFFADCNVALKSVTSPAFHRLIKMASPSAEKALPKRHTLAGRILSDYANEVSELNDAGIRAVQASTGGRFNLLSDAWENTSKQRILGVQLNLYEFIMVLGALECPSRGDGLAIGKEVCCF